MYRFEDRQTPCYVDFHLPTARKGNKVFSSSVKTQLKWTSQISLRHHVICCILFVLLVTQMIAFFIMLNRNSERTNSYGFWPLV